MTLAPEPIGLADRYETDAAKSDRASRSKSRARVSPIHVELVGARAMIAFQPAWSDLVERTLEPNVFLDPAFALPLLQHVRFDPKPDFLLVWENDSPTSFGRLVGLLPIHIPKSRWRLARGFHHPQVTLGTPLLDVQRGAEVMGAMLAWLGEHHPRLPGLVLKEIATDGAFFAALCDEARMSHRTMTLLDERNRAILRPADANAATGNPTNLSAKRRKELRRQRRRLADVGTLTYRSASSSTDLRRAVEQFLALEFDGWKGRRGTALLHDPTLATFTRSMTRQMAHEGRCRIDSLDLDGVPVAMGILVMAGTRAHFWKTTFDETFSALSPGVQFALDLTEAQTDDRGFTMTDSCAVPDHPMIDRIWTDRMVIADVVIALRPGQVTASRPSWAFRRAVRMELLLRRCRLCAKVALNAALR